jgi:5-methyltetrahydrofolate corrinoid/iron sulfur protein methyltransferase
MEIIGEDMHIMNQPFLEAVEKRDKQALIHFARRQVEAGATAIDINLGHSKKLGRLTPWLVETIQGAMSIPLFLSNHVVNLQPGLEVHRGVATINAVTAEPGDLVRAMQTAKHLQANLVVLLVSSRLTPMDVNGRLQLAMQVLECADKIGLSHRQLYLDPVIACRPDTST